MIDLGGVWRYQAGDKQGEMAVPSNWHCSGLPHHHGTVIFEREFDAPEPSAEWWLRFEGVDYRAQVMLNGHDLGNHEGYFQPFEFRVTDLLKVGCNHLQVTVESPFEEPGTIWPSRKRLIKGVLSHHDCRPGANDPQRGQDGNSGGIWNRVTLYRTPATRLRQVLISALPTTPASVTARCHLENISPHPLPATLRLRLFDPNDVLVCSHEKSLILAPGPATQTLVMTLETCRAWSTWDRGGPNLYRWEAELNEHRLQGTFGFRCLQLDGDWNWTLNGRRFFPRGTNIIPTQWLASYTAEDAARDVALLLQANLNMVRVHAHVTRPEFYDACDAAGILVWQDFALQWGYEESDAVRTSAVRQIREMAEMLYNHPSIGVWCCHNEPTHNRHTLDPLLESALREADSSRPVVAASDFSQHPYPGWYWGNLEEFHALPGAPFISEYGAQALPSVEALRSMLGEDNLWPTTPTQWQAWAYHDFQYDQTMHVATIDRGASIEQFVSNSQNYQYRLLKLATELYRSQKYRRVTGLLQFMFVDCWEAITWSVLDHARRPKRGFEALRLSMQPLLVTWLAVPGLVRRTLETRSLWSVLSICSPIVINDYEQDFENAELDIYLGSLLLQQIRFNIPADDVVRPVDPHAQLQSNSEEWKKNWLPVVERFSTLTAGPNVLRYVLRAGPHVSTNQDDVTLADSPLPAPSWL